MVKTPRLHIDLRRTTAPPDRHPHRRFAGALVLVPLLLASCAGTDAGRPRSSADRSARPIGVVASFYPLQWVAERVGGDAVAVDSLTPPGAEPHDLELAPRAVRQVADAGLVVYLSGFQPTVDDAVVDAKRAFDVHPFADLDLQGGDHDHEEEAHGEGAHEHEDIEGGVDPHFWLDPLRLADVGDALAVELAALAPARAKDFATRAASLRSDLEALDHDYDVGLADCASRDLVTSHEAFGYLAQRYGFTQRGILGLSPEAEPTPADLASTTDFVRRNHVRTIYFETLVSPAVARTLADEAGVKAAPLDPIEGLSESSAGDDYLAIMRSNLTALRAGQSCS